MYIVVAVNFVAVIDGTVIFQLDIIVECNSKWCADLLRTFCFATIDGSYRK